MKKLILKSEITKILNTYSVRKDEFEEIKKENLENYYKSKFARGYYIHISEEIEKSTRTGRIIVKHINGNGKITYNDIWERNEENKLEFIFRNTWNQPISDAEYIRDLKEDVELMREQYKKLIIENKNLKEQIENFNKNNSNHLQEEIEKLHQENQKLKNEKKHNARGAGRKPSQERINAIEEVQRLLATGTSENEIMNKLGISKATFYRYKKSIKN